MALTHKYTIICDDVRREDNGKLIILGVYMGAIVVPQLPFVLPTLTIFSMLEGDRPESWSWKLSLQNLEKGKLIAEARGFANVLKQGLVVMPMKFGAIRFEDPGVYSAALEIEGHKEPVTTSFTVALMPPNMGQPQSARS